MAVSSNGPIYRTVLDHKGNTQMCHENAAGFSC